MITIKELAEKLNLSQATVSRALRNDPTLSIPSDTRERIFSTAHDLGYVKKVTVVKKRRQDYHVLLIHKYQTFRKEIDSSYYFVMRAGIEDACSRLGLLCSTVAVEDLSDNIKQPDGILIIGNLSKEQYDRILQLFHDIPMVVVGIVNYYPERIDHVTYSNAASIEMAVDYLYQHGHRDIAYLGIEEAEGPKLCGSRLDAFVRAMSSKEILHPEWILESDHGTDRVVQGYKMMGRILQSRNLPTAVLCANDPLALGAINAMLEAGLRAPDDVSLIAHDGTYITQHSFPPLTVVDVHPYQLGVEGVELLIRRIQTPVSHSRSVCIYPTLIERDSVKTLPID